MAEKNIVQGITDIWEKFTNQSSRSSESSKDKQLRKITFFVDGTVFVHPMAEQDHLAAFFTFDANLKDALYLCIDPREASINLAAWYSSFCGYLQNFFVQVLKFLTKCQKCTKEELVGKDSDRVSKPSRHSHDDYHLETRALSAKFMSLGVGCGVRIVLKCFDHVSARSCLRACVLARGARAPKYARSDRRLEPVAPQRRRNAAGRGPVRTALARCRRRDSGVRTALRAHAGVRLLAHARAVRPYPRAVRIAAAHSRGPSRNGALLPQEPVRGRVNDIYYVMYMIHNIHIA
jgi:hypothetical protein